MSILSDPTIRINRDAVFEDSEGNAVSPFQAGEAVAIASATLNGERVRAMTLVGRELTEQHDDATLIEIARPALLDELAGLAACKGAGAT